MDLSSTILGGNRSSQEPTCTWYCQPGQKPVAPFLTENYWKLMTAGEQSQFSPVLKPLFELPMLGGWPSTSMPTGSINLTHLKWGEEQE